MSGFSIEQYYNDIESQLLSTGDPERAINQACYMKNQFDFIGLKAQEWMGILRQHYKDHGYPPDELIPDFSERCYKSAYREMHYVGLETVQRRLKHQSEDFIDQLKWLVVTNSWWDTVDWLASLIGQHLRAFPQLQPKTTDTWNQSSNMWLIRVSIIFQLKYKEDTDFALLKKYILAHWDSKEFFIRKAQGWALRQYGKFHPTPVVQFVKEHPEFSGLTRREALKHLQ
jgi:3-methyladenine DNA glycosylase AlkD